MTVSPVLRFAPSPNGFLHLGHAYSALMNERVAGWLGGTLRLRFEDIDRARCRPEHVSETLADLAWLGIGLHGAVWHQSTRLAAYAAALGTLAAADLLYPCQCSRGDIARAIRGRPDWPLDPDGAPLYPGTCRPVRGRPLAGAEQPGQPHALRLDMTAALQGVPADLTWIEAREGRVPFTVRAEPALWGDVVLARKDVPTSYHLSVVVDDAAQGITDVVRGEDLWAATGLHRLLQARLGLPAPRYHHHRLIRAPDGSKLAKSRNAPTLRALRLAGQTAKGVRDNLGFERARGHAPPSGRPPADAMLDLCKASGDDTAKLRGNNAGPCSTQPNKAD